MDVTAMSQCATSLLFHSLPREVSLNRFQTVNMSLPSTSHSEAMDNGDEME